MAGNVYAEISDLAAFGINPNATKASDPTAISKALAAASRRIDGFLRPQFKLPLLAWEDDLKEATCVIGMYTVMSVRGFNPENGADVNIRQRYKDQIDWLTQVSKGSVIPSVTDSSSGSAEGKPAARPIMTSSCQRGWSDPDGSSGGRAPFTGR